MSYLLLLSLLVNGRELPLHLPSYMLFFQDEVDTLNERQAEVVDPN